MYLLRLAPDAPASPDESSPEGLERWLGRLPADRPTETLRQLAEAVRRMRRRDTPLRVKVTLLGRIAEFGEGPLRMAEQRLAEAILPLARPQQEAVVEANRLLKELAAANQEIVELAMHRWYGMAAKRSLRAALTMAMHASARRLQLAWRIYARGSARAWHQLHELYRIARADGFAEHVPATGVPSPHAIYVRTLLLAFAEPAKASPMDLDRMRSYIERHATLARLVEPDGAEAPGQEEPACFLIRPREGRAGTSMLKQPASEFAPGDLILRARPLVDRLHQQIVSLEQGDVPARLGLPKIAAQPDFLALLRSLRLLWAAPPVRRYQRTRFNPRVDVVIGFDELWSFLAGTAFRRRSQDEPARLDARTSEWAIANESPDGFGLRYVGGNGNPARVGEVLGVRPRGTATVFVCVARRAVASSMTAVEIGVQALGARPLPATVRTSGGQRVRIVVLARLPGRTSQPALLAPPGRLHLGQTVALPHNGSRVTMRVREAIEHTLSCELFALEIAD